MTTQDKDTQDKVQGPLELVSEKYGSSAEKMAEALSGYQGFKEINRATVHRWIKAEKDGKSLPSRALLAITLLGDKGTDVTRLKIGLAPLFPSLPLHFLVTKTQEAERSYIETETNISVDKIENELGEECLKLLRMGEIDVAAVASSLLTPIPTDEKNEPLVRVCNFARMVYYMVGADIFTSSENSLKIGYLKGSSVPNSIIKMKAHLGIEVNVDPVAFDSLDMAKKSAEEEKIDTFIGLSSQMTCFENKFKVKASPLGYGEYAVEDIVLLANKQSILRAPEMIRHLLNGLVEVTQWFNRDSSSLDLKLIRTIAGGILGNNNWQNWNRATAGVQFQITQLNAGFLLECWEAEIKIKEEARLQEEARLNTNSKD